MKRILINATQREELRVAMVDGQELVDLDIEIPGKELRKANIYKARIVRVEPSLEAAFVDYGMPRHGFLPFREISSFYYRNKSATAIKDAIAEGQELIVQVTQDERGDKGAALTTNPSLPGRYLVLMPHNPRAGGISRQIEGEEREELQQIATQLTSPEGSGFIIRTAGIGHSAEELQWDLDNQVRLWEAIQKASEKPAPLMLYSDNDIVIRVLRDNLRNDIGEVVIDDEETYQKACKFVERSASQFQKHLSRHDSDVPLFSHYQIESQIESAHNRVVHLPSGGTIAIDHTEALVSIDINSARATKSGDIETTALQTNLEAAREIARQLRLRNLGGLIVIDFIDMVSGSNQKKVENEFRESSRVDRARVQIGHLSRFGMLELSRQRIRPPLGQFTQIMCPRCGGHGSIRTVQSLALDSMRLLEEEAMKQNTGMVVIELPIAVTSYLFNEKREAIQELAHRHGSRIRVLPVADLEVPHYRLYRYKDDAPELSQHFDYSKPELSDANLRVSTTQEQNGRKRNEHRRNGRGTREQETAPRLAPAVDVTEHITSSPRKSKPKQPSLLEWLLQPLQRAPKNVGEPPAEKTPSEAPAQPRSRNSRRQRRGGGQRHSQQAHSGNGSSSESPSKRRRGRRGGRNRRRGGQGGDRAKESTSSGTGRGA